MARPQVPPMGALPIYLRNAFPLSLIWASVQAVECNTPGHARKSEQQDARRNTKLNAITQKSEDPLEDRNHRPGEALLLLTADDHLAAAWESLADSVQRARSPAELPAWRARGHRLVLADLGAAGKGPALWESTGWRDSVAGLSILAASSIPSDDEGLVVLNAGASGYCHTHAPQASLRQALDVIASGELWVGRSLLSRLLRLLDGRLPRAGLADWTEHLTHREQEVAHHAALGESNLTIALALGITERTVKAHLKSVFEKLHVADRLQLALRVHGVR